MVLREVVASHVTIKNYGHIPVRPVPVREDGFARICRARRVFDQLS